MWKYEKEFREAHPETIGETDKEFDNYNYTEWLEKKLEKLFAIPIVVNLACSRCKKSLSPKITDGECIICNTKL